jgi:hypothetical protein
VEVKVEKEYEGRIISTIWNVHIIGVHVLFCNNSSCEGRIISTFWNLHIIGVHVLFGNNS